MIDVYFIKFSILPKGKCLRAIGVNVMIVWTENDKKGNITLFEEVCLTSYVMISGCHISKKDIVIWKGSGGDHCQEVIIDHPSTVIYASNIL